MTPEASADLLAFFVLVAVDVLRAALVLFAVWLMVPRRRACPQCNQPTEPLIAPLLRWVLLERRWCLACGWQGVARRGELPGAGAPTARGSERKSSPK